MIPSFQSHKPSASLQCAESLWDSADTIYRIIRRGYFWWYFPFFLVNVETRQLPVDTNVQHIDLFILISNYIKTEYTLHHLDTILSTYLPRVCYILYC